MDCKSIEIYRNTVTIVLDTDTVTNWDRLVDLYECNASYVHCNNNDIFFIFTHCSCFIVPILCSVFFFVLYWVSEFYWICYIILFFVIINGFLHFSPEFYRPTVSFGWLNDVWNSFWMLDYCFVRKFIAFLFGCYQNRMIFFIHIVDCACYYSRATFIFQSTIFFYLSILGHPTTI